MEVGSPISRSLAPFSSNDVVQSFLSGALWGGAAIGFLALGAWLVSIMRQRVFFTPATAAAMAAAAPAAKRDAELELDHARILSSHS